MNRQRMLLLFAAVGALVVFLTMSVPLRAQTAVFINEIHYDNSGTDSGEAIEVAGPAGTDLSGWSLVLYNGSVQTEYNTTTLSGVIPDLENGFGAVFVSYPSNGIQNGSPDGIALVDDTGAVVQFLSYEGSFTAVGGPADGMTSTDIGVSEASGTAVGDSLQLTGTGTTYEDFAWASPQPNTFGAVNAGQSFGSGGGGGPAAPPVINEFVFNHTGSDVAAFIEVLGDANADYSAYTVLEIEGDSSGAGTIDAVLSVGTTDGGGFWTSSEDVENGTVTLLLVEGFSGSAGNDLDTNNDGTLDVTPWTAVVDTIAVTDGGSSDHAYSSVVLTPGFDGISFSVGGASRIPNGTDSDSAADWVRNDFSGLGLPGLIGSIDAGEAVNTPGAENAQLAADLTSIFDIQFTASGSDSPLVGQTVTTAGVVTAVLDNGDAVFMQDGQGPWSGIYIFRPSPVPAVGDVVQLTDEVEEFNGLTEFAFSSIDVLAAGAAVPDPESLATGDVGQEQWESVLVRVENVTVTDDDLGFGEWSVSDSSGDVRVDDLGVFGYAPTTGDALDFVQGPLYFSFGNFKIEPRGDDDIGVPPPPAEACGDPFTPIYDIQGSGSASPLDNTVVSTEGVVVGDFQDNDGDPFDTDLGGFFIQDADGDGSSATSDGIFVDAPGMMDVQVGDTVRVAGTVDEFFDLTEITNVTTVLPCGSGATVAATEVTLPVDSIDDLEMYEGMLVTFPQQLTISEFFNFDRFGEIVLTTDRQYQPTATYDPGTTDAANLADLNERSRITLDDGRGSQNPDPARHPNGNVFDLGNTFRGGDSVQNVTGVLSYSFGLYRIQPTTGADYAVQNPRPAAPADVGGNITVAAFNVLNYFNTIDTGAEICGPLQDQECRGADNETERIRQLDKIVSAMATMGADVLGIIEVENTAGVEAMADIVDGLNAIAGPGTYAYVDTGTIGPDVIKVGFIYNTTTVSLVGDYAVLDTPEFIDPNNLGDPKNRAALAQTFIDNETGGIFTAVVNHLKSKGSPCGPGDDDPEAGSCNLTRALAAQELADWLATDPTDSGDPDFLIIGDLNAYDKEDPIDVLKANGYSDLLFEFVGEDAYSYVFDGQLGYLDYGMANDALRPEVTGTTAWHINTDEPDILDYDTTFKQDAQDALYEVNAYRSSDHDPVIVGLDLNGSPVCAGAMPSQDTLWPPNGKFVAIDVLGVTDPEGDPITITIDSIFQDEAVDAPGSGNTAPDGQGVGTSTAEVRAERAGNGNGRYYHISFTATDSFGNSCSGIVKVSVPKNKGRNGAAVDDGPLFDSTVAP